MIIQHPDGSYEICPLTPAAARWLRALLRRAPALWAERGAARAAAQPGCAPCLGDRGARCASP